MQHQWDEMHRTRKPTFVLCGEPQGDVLNLYVHGYSAFFNQQQLGSFSRQLATIEGSTNLMLFWPAGHFLENLFAPFKDVITSMLGGGSLGAATIGVGKAIAYFLDHYKSVEARVDEVAKSLLPELANYLHGESIKVRQINLIGHSLGARILVKSLLASPEVARELPLNNLLLMGGAICTSSPPNQNLENARTNFSALQANPQATKVAALETKDASDWLDKADKAYRDKEDQKKVDQLAYLTNQRVEVAKDTIVLRESEAKLKNAGDERARALLQARDAQIKQLQDSLNAKQTDRGTLVTFGDVLFATNKSDLKSSGLVNITKLAQFLRDNPDRKVIVEGYTDSTGSDSYNQSLSERRAASVQRALANQGVDISRIVTQGYGKEYPVADNGSVSGRAMNRRFEVTISNDNQPVKPRSSMAN